jgi:uncharacterized protein YfaP (DUF2135 family)
MLGLLALAVVAAPPTVQITSPMAGWTTERIVTVTGTAQGGASLGTLVVNGVERPLPINGGQFTATFALGRGENAIEVLVPSTTKGEPSGRARLNLVAQIPRVDLQVLLFWDTDKTDVDLHVTEPGGEVVNYTHTVSEQTGGRLDRDDTDGYGPEIYSLGSAPSGTYTIEAHYFGDRDTGQSSATVIVVAREGTDEERRWRFEVPLTRQGEKVTLAKIDLPPPGMALESPTVGKPGAAPVHQRDSELPRAGGR